MKSNMATQQQQQQQCWGPRRRQTKASGHSLLHVQPFARYAAGDALKANSTVKAKL